MPQQPLVTGINQHPYKSSHPVHSRLDLNIASRDNFSSFTQRVMSAKLLRLKQMQNELSEAHLQLNELCTENRLLRALQKRQDLALERYEGSQAQLPQLVRSHQEEVRILRSKYKNLKHQCRTVTNTLKEREGELQNLKEQHAHLLKLSKDRNLGDRESLTKQVNELKLTVENQSNTIQILNRKVLLESKNLKFQLQQEMQKHRTTQSELQHTFVKLDQLQAQLDQAKERNSLPASIDRFGKTPSVSKLAGGQKSFRATLIEKSSPIQEFKNSRIKKATKAEGSVNNADVSSTQLDSSPATYSGKTNDFSTSLESSPEHTTNGTITREKALPLEMTTNSYQFHRSNMEKSKPVHFDSVRDSKFTDSSYSNASLCDDVLEKEYENAVAMLSELSTSHKSDFLEDVSTQLPSLDLTSAKHVASLANATFALKVEPQFLPKTKTKQDQQSSSPSKLNLRQGESGFSTDKKSRPTNINEDKKFLKTRRASDFQQESDFRSPIEDTKLENNLEVFKLKSKSTDDLLTNVEPPIQKPHYDKEDNLQTKRRNNDEEVEASRKEALLKALKAIDDSSIRGNNSDDSDSDVMKMSGNTMIPHKRFSSLNSTSIGITDKLGSRRSKPYK